MLNDTSLANNVIPMKDYFDAREPSVRIDPDAEPWIDLRPEARDGAADASLHRAIAAQRKEREDAIAANIAHDGIDLLRQQTLDSLIAERVAKVLPHDMSQQDRRDAGAIAIRVHDPRWQAVSRYQAADALLIELRKSQGQHGWYLADSEMRALADKLAGIAHVARYRVWTGQVAITARMWTKAALGFLSLTEDR